MLLCRIQIKKDEILKGIQKLWIAGQHIAIDESMIKYMGRAITLLQFTKNKPIKHGIKVFACCCAYSGVILSFLGTVERKILPRRRHPLLP
jgi:hypothetical protein